MHGSIPPLSPPRSRADTPRPPGAEPAEDHALRLVHQLCDALDRAAIEYCHWKSTNMIHRSATGENDLDLLIAASDLDRFSDVLHTQGCWKEVVATGGAQIPGIRHFYGLDVDSGRLVDIHAHEWLLIGDDATKNYHLPIEAAYLRSANHDGLFPIPAPEFEFIVLVVRLMLKHGSPEAILTGRGRVSSGERCEMDHLSARVEASRIRRALQDDVPFLDERILAFSIRALEPGCPTPIRLEAWQALQARLAPHARRARPADVWLQTSRRIGRRFRTRVLGRPARRQLSDGGHVVAIVGGDGAGKSTTVAELARWLSPLAPTVTLHLGKPRRSAMWFVLRGTVRLGRAVGAHPTVQAAGAPPPGEPNGWSYVWLLTGVVNARDRSREAARAHVLASRGAIVLCDRYPLPGTIDIDGPRVDQQQASGMTGLRRRSVEFERTPYCRIRPPDSVVVLRVDPDVAVARRPEADPRLVRSRAEHIRTASWPAGTLVVEADASRERVLRDVKAGIWTRL